jgi:hypothetical protein
VRADSSHPGTFTQERRRTVSNNNRSGWITVAFELVRIFIGF